MFGPIMARTFVHHEPTGPVTHDCVKLIFVRAGSAILFSEFGQRSVTLGDVVILGGNTLCGGEPEGHVTITTIYLDSDYVIDQVFWQYAAVLSDRLHAQQFAETIYTEPVQVVRLGEDRAGMLMPWLDELVALSIDGPATRRFYRTQALLCAVLDVLIPFVKTTPAPACSDRPDRPSSAAVSPAACRGGPGSRSAARFARRAVDARCAGRAGSPLAEATVTGVRGGIREDPAGVPDHAARGTHGPAAPRGRAEHRRGRKIGRLVQPQPRRGSFPPVRRRHPTAVPRPSPRCGGWLTGRSTCSKRNRTASPGGSRSSTPVSRPVRSSTTRRRLTWRTALRWRATPTRST